jgi:ribA/ribD-fused uncharacterized protein
MEDINFFEDRYFFLSNFYPCSIIYEGITYPSSEHSYQASKSLDTNTRLKVALAPTPGMSKRIGKQLKIRPNWNDIRYPIMKDIVRIKFTTHLDIRKKLLDTDNVKLTEGNLWHDNYFGVCHCAKCGSEGKNSLGQILMDLREELRNLDA